MECKQSEKHVTCMMAPHWLMRVPMQSQQNEKDLCGNSSLAKRTTNESQHSEKGCIIEKRCCSSLENTLNKESMCSVYFFKYETNLCIIVILYSLYGTCGMCCLERVGNGQSTR